MELLDKEIQILKMTDSIGNKVLYDLCEEYPLAMDMKIEALSAQIWLIGRSYAASPERRSYGVGSITDGGNGLDTFFERLAEKIVKHNDFVNLINSLSELKGKYSFLVNEIAVDMEKMNKTIECVNSFNKIIMDARLEVDREVLGDRYEKAKENQKGVISFCSKFLHFHFRDLFFIKDSITESHLTYNDNRKKCRFIFDNGKESKIKLERDEVDKIISDYYDNKKDTYTVHCVKEYLLGTRLKENAHIQPSPRIIDTYVLNANVKMKV